MENPAALSAECETIAAAGRLVVETINLRAGIVAEWKRPDGAVTDEEDIARPVPAQDLFGLVQNPPLRIDRALPASDAGKRMLEELVR
jgi:hypothetical protein